MGNLTRDPQLSYLPSQTPVCELGLAINEKFKDREGNQREQTCFVDCRAFGNTAEALAKWFTKGKPILVEGKLEFDQWEAQDGSKRSKHRVKIERWTFVGDGEKREQQPPSMPRNANAPQAPPNGYNNQPTDGAPSEEDIPF
jgi:single-strand DNA-binding protein